MIVDVSPKATVLHSAAEHAEFTAAHPEASDMLIDGVHVFVAPDGLLLAVSHPEYNRVLRGALAPEKHYAPHRFTPRQHPVTEDPGSPTAALRAAYAACNGCVNSGVVSK